MNLEYIENYLKLFNVCNFYEISDDDKPNCFENVNLYFNEIYVRENYKDYLYKIEKFSEVSFLINYYVNNDHSRFPMVVLL